MIALLLFAAAGAAAVVGVWPMALAGAVLGLLVLVGQRTDDAVWVDEADAEAAGAGAGGTMRALGLLVMWALIGLLGLVALGVATMAVL